MKKAPFSYEKSDFFAENERFFKLIKHYAYRLNYFGAELDLWGFLFELLQKNKPPSDSYIVACLRNKYCKLCRAELKHKNAPLLYDSGAFENFDFWIDFKSAIALLTEQQRKAFVLRNIYGFSDIEIGKRLGISRQAVNRLQRRAVNKLRETMSL